MRSPFFSVLFLLVSMTCYAAQAVNCIAILGIGTAVQVQSSKPHLNEKTLIKASRWLKKESDKINPSETHLQGLVPLVTDYISDLKRILPTKSDQPLYAERSGQILQILNETLERIGSRRLTYEFVYGLPFRISMFLDMTASFAERPDVYVLREDMGKNENGVALSLTESTYLTHENFMNLLGRLSSKFYSERDFFVDHLASDFSFWIHVDLAMRNFKTAKLLPFVGELSIEAMNEMSDAGVWPLGTFLKPATLDGLSYTERGATLHDLLHATLYFFDSTARESYFHPPVRVEIMNSIKEATYAKIKSASVRDPDQQWLLQFIQHVVFHELGRDAYQLKKDLSHDPQAELHASIAAVQFIYQDDIQVQLAPDLHPNRRNRFYNHLRHELEEKFPSLEERNIKVKKALAQFKIYLIEAARELK